MSEERDIEAIRQLRAAVEEAERKRDAAAFAELFTADIAMLPPGNRIAGAGEVEDFHRRLYAHFQELDVRFTIERIDVLGDLAVESGTYVAQSKDNEGKRAESGGRYLYTYERQDDGSWKIHRMSWG